MKILAKRPALYLWAVALAMLAAHAHHFGGRGFHQW
jgi:hypothetical protein